MASKAMVAMNRCKGSIQQLLLRNRTGLRPTVNRIAPFLAGKSHDEVLSTREDCRDRVVRTAWRSGLNHSADLDEVLGLKISPVVQVTASPRAPSGPAKKNKEADDFDGSEDDDFSDEDFDDEDEDEFQDKMESEEEDEDEGDVKVYKKKN